MTVDDRGASRTYKIIDLFAGCGGLTAGFAATGRFQPVAAVERDRLAAATYAMNFGEDHVFAGDIGDWLMGPLPDADVVIGGPPCQGFSALGTRNPRDPRNSLWRRYVDAVRRVRPIVFVLENVPQFLTSSQYQALRRETAPRGQLADYELEAHILNSVEYGVAQTRKRAAVIGRLNALPEFGSPPTTQHKCTLHRALRGIATQVNVIDLPESRVDVLSTNVQGAYKTVDLHVTRRPTERSLERFRWIPPGGNRHDLPDWLSTPGWRKHKTGSADVMGRLVWSKPSVTIRTEFFKPEKGRYLHPDEHRPITHFEAARIQGFADDFLWCGNKIDIARQIGNAVPVGLAEALARHLVRRIDELLV
jgi:DNA (cytosine-5)-methyltransferase 1